MSLNVVAGLLKLDGDSSGAQKALEDTKQKSQELEKNTNDLGGSFGTMIGKLAPLAVGLAGVTAVFSLMKKSYTQWMEAQREGADAWSQFGDNAWYAASQIKGVMNNLDNMVKLQTVARSYNILVKSEIGASTEELRSMGAMAIKFARATGGNMDDAMNQLTDAVQKGKAKAFLPFGVILNSTRAEIDANTIALKKFGRAANEEEIQIQRSKAALGQINEKYKDIKISASDINEIEAKYTNTRKGNMAIASKLTEGYAMELQKLKHGATDTYDTILNSMNGLSARQKDINDMMFIGMNDMLPQIAQTISGNGENIKAEVNKITAEIAKIKEEAGRDTESGALLTTDAQDAQIAKLEARIKDLNQLEFKLPTKQFEALNIAISQTGDISKLTNADLKTQAESFLALRMDAQKAADGLKLFAKVTAEMENISKSPMEKMIVNQRKTIVEFAKSYQEEMDKILAKADETAANLSRETLARDVTETLGKGDEIAIKYLSTQTSIASTIKYASEIEATRINKQIDFNSLKENEKAEVENVSRMLSQQADDINLQKESLGAQIQIIKTAEKDNHKLTATEKARLEVLKNQYAAMEKQEGSIVNQIASLVSWMKGMDKGQVQANAKGNAETWVKEYYNTLKILKGNNEDAKAGILDKYGSDDPKIIKQKMQLENKNKDLLALERKYADETIKLDKEKSEAKLAQIDAEREMEENEKKRRQEEIKAELKDESDRITGILNPRINYMEKIAALASTEKTTAEKALINERKALQTQIDATEEAFTQLAAHKQKLIDTDGLTIEQQKEFAALEESLLKKQYELKKEYKDKGIALKKEENKEMKELMKQVGNDLKGYGESIIKSTGSAMFEAMAMSDEALKESNMSRAEMQKRALAEELKNISKQAFIQSLWEGAKSIASYAVGDAKGGTMHAAAALAYAAISGTAYLAASAVNAPSDAEIARRKAKSDGEGNIENSSASVAGASSGGKTVVINVYWPQGMIIGDKDSVAKQMNIATQDAIRRGKI